MDKNLCFFKFVDCLTYLMSYGKDQGMIISKFLKMKGLLESLEAQYQHLDKSV